MADDKPREMYRISKMHRNSKNWQPHGGKFTDKEATQIKKRLEKDGWTVTVYRAT